MPGQSIVVNWIFQKNPLTSNGEINSVTDKYLHFVILLADTISPRLQFISDFIGREINGKPIRLTSDIEVFKQYQGPRISYTLNKPDTEAYHVRPHSLLFEQDIREQDIDCFTYQSEVAFFKVNSQHPFDIFAAAFYLLSRYEEYLPHEKDIYGRYAHTNSLAFRKGFLDKPLVNIWIKDFRERLQQMFTHYQLPPHNRFIFLPTYDIDEAFAYKYKSWWRVTGGLIRSLLRFDFHSVAERIAVMTGKKTDPYDSYKWIEQLHQNNHPPAQFFFLLAPRTYKYDKNILPRVKKFRRLISDISRKFVVGIHPSWQSGENNSVLHSEILTLEKIINKKVRFSRQHYIRFSMPSTFRELIKQGITADYSMGYGSINGFRASVASIFYWYDLENEHTTPLSLYPFCYMEANSYFEQKYTAEQALEEMRQYFRKVREVDGLLITLWHNSFLGSAKRFKGWKEVYEIFVKEVKRTT